jgi:hypothetical protein
MSKSCQHSALSVQIDESKVESEKLKDKGKSKSSLQYLAFGLTESPFPITGKGNEGYY